MTTNAVIRELTTTNPAGLRNGLRTTSAGRPYVNGNRKEANNFLLDGIDNNQVSDNLTSYQPNIDAIQEVKLITNNASAEFGNFQGGIVNVVIWDPLVGPANTQQWNLTLEQQLPGMLVLSLGYVGSHLFRCHSHVSISLSCSTFRARPISRRGLEHCDRCHLGQLAAGRHSDPARRLSPDHPGSGLVPARCRAAVRKTTSQRSCAAATAGRHR